MGFAYQRGNFTLEDSFARPFFELADVRLQVLRRLYDSLSPRFTIDPRDLRVNATDNLGDLRVTLAAFGGAGRVELSPTFAKVTFEQLRSPEDWDVVREFSTMVDAALGHFIPIEQIGLRTAQRRAFLSASEGFIADQFLGDLVSDRARLDPAKLDAEVCDYGIQIKLRGEAWVTEFLLEKSLDPDAALFVHSATRYFPRVRSMIDTIVDSERWARAIMTAYGVEY